MLTLIEMTCTHITQQYIRPWHT